MFNDRQKALEELEAELLLEEILEEQQDEDALLYRNFSNNYGQPRSYNRDVRRERLEEYSDQVLEEPKPESLRGLTALALALLAGIFVMLAYWAVRYL